MHANDPYRQQRENFLSVFLAGLAALSFLAVLVLISSIFLYVLMVAAAMFLVGMIHYLLWGKVLSDEVAGEREEEQLRQRAQAGGWPAAEPYGVRRR